MYWPILEEPLHPPCLSCCAPLSSGQPRRPSTTRYCPTERGAADYNRGSIILRCVAEMGAVRARLGTDTALRALRTLAAAQLPALPTPLGFHPHRLDTTNRNRAFQHNPDSTPVASPVPSG